MAERLNQETDPRYNRKSGIAIERGTPYADYMAQFEQFENNPYGTPGNPYKYRPFPKMVYRAQRVKGKAVCLMGPPDPTEFTNPDHLAQQQEAAQRFSEGCQLIVNDEKELQKAMENGYRHSPEEAVKYLQARRQAEFVATGERGYEDRGMSEAAKAEAAEAARRIFDEEGRQAPEIPERPRRKRGRPRKTPEAA